MIFMGKFCPGCGRENVDFYKGFCVDCYTEMHKFAEIPKTIRIVKCRKCGLWNYRNEWVEESFHLLEKIVKGKIKTELYNFGIGIDVKDDVLLISIHGTLERQGTIPVEKSFESKIEYLEKKLCENCVNLSGKHHELIIQVRKKEKPDKEKYNTVVSFIKKNMHHLMFDYPKARVFWWKELKEGDDFYFGTREVGEHLLKLVTNKFGLKSEMSTKLKGITESGKKDVEFTYCVRV